MVGCSYTTSCTLLWDVIVLLRFSIIACFACAFVSVSVVSISVSIDCRVACEFYKRIQIIIPRKTKKKASKFTNI